MISQPTKTPWILTKDKLPEREDWVLICSRLSVPITAIYEGDRWVTIDSDEIVDEPDFWMPIPFVPIEVHEALAPSHVAPIPPQHNP